MRLSNRLVCILLSSIFLISRLVNLYYVPAWEDNFSWLYRINYYPWVVESSLKGINEEGKDLAFSGRLSYHPGVTIMTLSGASTRIGKKVLTNLYPDYKPCDYNEAACPFLQEELFIAKLPLILISTLFLYLSLSIISRSQGILPALLFGVIVLSEPLFYTTSRDLHLDFLQAIFVCTSFLYFVLGSTKVDKFISGSALGLAILTRFSSVFFAPAFLLLGLFYKHKLKDLANIFLLSAGFFVLMYPAMWVNPIGTIKYIVSGSLDSTSSHIKVGADANYIEGFGVYLKDFFIYVSPYWFALFVSSLVLLSVRKVTASKPLVIHTLLFFTLFFLFLNISDKRFFRYLTPILMGYSVVISYVLGEFLSGIKATKA